MELQIKVILYMDDMDVQIIHQHPQAQQFYQNTKKIYKEFRILTKIQTILPIYKQILCRAGQQEFPMSRPYKHFTKILNLYQKAYKQK